MKTNKNIVIIPARKNSKRLPNKNLKHLLGLPLIVYSILYAKENTLGKIIVSSDDKGLKEICIKYNVDFQLRPLYLASDVSPTVNTLKYVLQTLNEEYANVILLQPTNPLRPVSLLKDAYQRFLDSNCDSLMTVSRNHQKLGKIINSQFEPFNYTMGQRSQDLEPLYFENGLLYITKASLIFEDKILGANNLPFIVNHPYASVDIDTQEDFELAEFILKQYPNA